MLRVASLFSVVTFVALVACSSDEESGPVKTASEGSTRAVTCAKAECKGDDFCCGSPGWGDASCKPSCGGQRPMACDDVTDCQPGSVCCFFTEGGQITSSECASTCTISDTAGQLCKQANAGECRDGTCTPVAAATLPTGFFECIPKK